MIVKKAEIILDDIKNIINVFEGLVGKTPEEIVETFKKKDIYFRIQEIEDYYNESEFVKKYQNAQAEILSVKASAVRVLDMAECHHVKLWMKLEFELIPLAKNLRFSFYFYNWIYPDKEKIRSFFEREVSSYYYSPYVENAKKTGKYKYDLSIFVLGYNKIEYTKACVKSLKKFLPNNIKYELIFINHGSSDGTKEFFESEDPDKQIDIEVNGGGTGVIDCIAEGKYGMVVCNDVLVTKNSIDNMYKCITSDEKIGWVVATTSNVSNLQSIEASYSTLDELYLFAEKNNISNERKWEEKVRLCNPIDIYNVEVMIDCICKKMGRAIGVCFPDDKLSYGFRRAGYKLMLAKDAYCHHFGSVTIKDEIPDPLAAEKIYTKGRIDFIKELGIDPWGYGFCHDLFLMQNITLNEENSGNILGINSGMGENPIKIRNLLKEKFGRKDSKITYLTQYEMNLEDMEGLGDKVFKVNEWTEYENLLEEQFAYILLENGVDEYNYKSILGLFDFLTKDGILLVRITTEDILLKIKKQFSIRELVLQKNNIWIEMKKNRD